VHPYINQTKPIKHEGVAHFLYDLVVNARQLKLQAKTENGKKVSTDIEKQKENTLKMEAFSKKQMQMIKQFTNFDKMIPD
jgi:hypothetical protein